MSSEARPLALGTVGSREAIVIDGRPRRLKEVAVGLLDQEGTAADPTLHKEWITLAKSITTICEPRPYANLYQGTLQYSNEHCYGQGVAPSREIRVDPDLDFGT